MNQLVSFENEVEVILPWVPTEDNPTSLCPGGIVLPFPVCVYFAHHMLDICLFDLGLQKAYNPWPFLLQEDFDVFLLIWGIHAPNISTYYLIHMGLSHPPLYFLPLPEVQLPPLGHYMYW